MHPMYGQSSIEVMNVSDHCRNYIQKHINTCYSIIGSIISYKAKVRKVHEEALVRVFKNMRFMNWDEAAAQELHAAKKQKFKTEQD